METVTNLYTARSCRDLLEHTPSEGPYDFESLFPVEGWLDRLRSKRKMQLLRRIDSRLRALLDPDERVFFITTGVEHSLIDGFFLGWLEYYINRKAFVFTTKRILLLQIGSRGNPLFLRSQLGYESINGVRSTWSGGFRLRLKNGKKVLFTRIPRADRKYVESFINDLTIGLDDFPDDSGIVNICPHCPETVDGFPDRCPECGGGYKRPKVAALRSLAFPGAGDFYLGHKTLAVFEMLVAAYLWIFVVFLYVDPATEELSLVVEPFLIIWAFVIMHGLDSLATLRIAKKGIYPD